MSRANPGNAWLTGYMVCFGCGRGADECIHTWVEGSEPCRCPYCLEYLCVPSDGLGFGDAQELASKMDL